MSGKIILLNGASSSGKSTLAHALQSAIAQPFWHISIDHLRAAQVLPQARIDSGEFPWASLRSQFFEGFHRTLPALTAAGNNLIVEHIIETQEWMQRLLGLLGHLDVFFVGLHCSLQELERRELTRGDRRIGEARTDFHTAHAFCTYDLELDSARSVEANVQEVISAWTIRPRPSAFEKLAPSGRRS